MLGIRGGSDFDGLSTRNIHYNAGQKRTKEMARKRPHSAFATKADALSVAANVQDLMEAKLQAIQEFARSQCNGTHVALTLVFYSG